MTRDQTVFDAEFEERGIQILKTRALAAARAAEQRHAARTEMDPEELIHRYNL